MLKRIMVPVDGSGFAEYGLPPALALVRATGARLHLVMVHEPPLMIERSLMGLEVLEAQQKEMEEEYLTALFERLTEQGMNAERSVITGTPADALANFARRRDIDLIVMSTHGHGGLSRYWIGSVADGLIRRSRVPVLLFRPVEGASGPGESFVRRVLVAVDGSPASERALPAAADICAATGAACTLIRVVVPPSRAITSRLPDTARMVRERTEEESREAEAYLRDLVGESSLPDSTRTEIVTGYDAAAAIVRTAETERADMIAVGTRGHGGAARMLLGSVADKLIRASPVPVLVCPSRR
ncbi:MAG TPA: universal stress protein [Longimicrobiales bacterium]|nr:universal stress protein [Longimicrobiales bacterium]